MTNNSYIDHLQPISSRLELPATNDIPEWFTITFAAVNGGGFCLNTLSLWLLATRKFVYRYKVNTFIVSLCFSDFLVALSSFYFLATITSKELTLFSKRVATIVFGFALETSLMSICFLSYERLTAIRKPFQYNEILSKTRIIVIMVLGWMFCICLLAMQFVFGFIYRHEKYVYFNWVVFTSLSLVSISFLALVYVYLIYEIRRHSLHMRSCSIKSRTEDFYSDVSSEVSRNDDQLTEVTYASGSTERSRIINEKTLGSTASSPMNIPRRCSRDRAGSLTPNPDRRRANSADLLKTALTNTRECNKRVSGEKRRLSARGALIRKERRSVLFCLCIVFAFAATWLPVAVFFLRCLLAHTCETDDQLLFICTCLVSVNALLDPILYFIIKREFRDFLFGKICRTMSGNRRRGSGDSRRGSSGNFI